MKRHPRTLLLVALPCLVWAAPALADDYPVSGKWTYENPTGDGPAESCGQRYMSFDGNQRRDTGGGVPGYRNFSIEQNGNEYNIVDQFNTGQIDARSSYTLRKTDEDHIELNLSPGSKVIKLRRCE